MVAARGWGKGELSNEGNVCFGFFHGDLFEDNVNILKATKLYN